MIRKYISSMCVDEHPIVKNEIEIESELVLFPSVHRCNLLYKLLYKIRRSPRWINDLHSRFIVWANMKYFSFLIWFRLCTVHSSLYMFKYLFACQFVFFPPYRILFLGWLHNRKKERKIQTQIQTEPLRLWTHQRVRLYVCLNELWKYGFYDLL